MKKGSTFLVLVLVVVFAMGGVFVARSMQGNNEASRGVQATEVPKEVSGGAVAQMPTKVPGEDLGKADRAEGASSGQNVKEPSTGQNVVTPNPVASAAPKATTVPTAVPTVAPTSTPRATSAGEDDTEMAGVSKEEIAAVAELMGVSEEEVALVVEKAAENGYTFDVDAMKSGEVDIQELWGVVTEALGEERAYELLIKALGSNLF